MTDIKKFGLGALVTALFAAMALSMMATAVEANALSISRSPSSITNTGTSTINVFAEDDDGNVTAITTQGTLTSTLPFVGGNVSSSVVVYDSLVVIDGDVDVNRDGTIDTSDDCTDCINVGGTYVNIIDGKIDANNDGSITTADDGADNLVVTGLGDGTVDIIDGQVDVNEDAAITAADDATVDIDVTTTTFTLTCSAATCTSPSTITVQGIQDNVSVSNTVNVQGSASTMTVTILEADPTGSSSCNGAEADAIAANGATRGDVTATVCVLVKDAAGNSVPTGTNVVFTTTEGTLSANSAQTNSNGRATVTLTRNSSAAAGDIATVTATAGSAVGTDTVVFGGNPASCSITTTPAIASTSDPISIQVTVLDSTGAIVADDGDVDQTVDITAVHTGTGTNATVVGGTDVEVENGQATATAVSAITGTLSVIASVDGVSGVNCSKAVQVTGTGTGTPPPTTGDGSFASAPTFSANGVGSAVFNGGTIEQLATAVTASGGTAVWVQGDDGNWYRYSVGATGATAFVNNAFNAEFAGGFTGAVAVFVVQ